MTGTAPNIWCSLFSVSPLSPFSSSTDTNVVSGTHSLRPLTMLATSLSSSSRCPLCSDGGDTGCSCCLAAHHMDLFIIFLDTVAFAASNG